MLVHAFLTDGFFPWAELFIESFKYHNGEDIPIVLCTRNLSNKQIHKLYSLHNNITIENEKIDLKRLADKFGISYNRLLEYKHQVEKMHITAESKIWKQYTSADQRIRSIYETMKKYTDQDFIFHSDIDMYIRTDLTDLFNLIKDNDISIRFRLKASTPRKVMGGLIGFKVNEEVFKFMERWEKYLNDVPIPKRKIGYGQSSFFFAYRDLKNNYKWGDIPQYYISPKMDQRDKIWSANTMKGKTKNLEICRRDFEKCKKQ